jgi:hypothetical protein
MGGESPPSPPPSSGREVSLQKIHGGDGTLRVQDVRPEEDQTWNQSVKSVGKILNRNRFNMDTADNGFVVRKDLFAVCPETGNIQLVASRVFVIVSSTVSPCEKQPGSAGTSAQTLRRQLCKLISWIP